MPFIKLESKLEMQQLEIVSGFLKVRLQFTLLFTIGYVSSPADIF